jgi:hypothetical protein
VNGGSRNAYIDNQHGTSRFRWVKAPTSDELTQLTHTIARRVARYLERQGLLVRDGESTYLTAEGVGADNETPIKITVPGTDFIEQASMDR